MAKLQITQIRGVVGEKPQMGRTLRGLGLRRIGQSVEQPDNPAIRGMVRTVRHLITVEEVD